MSDKSGKSGCVWTVVIVVGICLLVGRCRSCSNEKKSVRDEKVQVSKAVTQTKKRQPFKEKLATFLAEYEPSLSARRDETILAIRSNEETRNKLRANIDEFPGEEAKAFFRGKVERYDKTIRQLNQLLAAIDSKAEIAMAQREASLTEGGGMQEADSQALLDSAAIILSQAAALQNDLEVLSNDDAAPSVPSEQLPDKKEKPADPRIKELEKMADNVAAALELMNKREAEEAKHGNAPASQKPTQPSPKAEIAPDRETIQKEIRRLDASIAIDEANLNRAWARIHQITRNGTVPIVKGSKEHVAYVSAHRILVDCEARLPGLKNRRDDLKAMLGN